MTANTTEDQTSQLPEEQPEVTAEQPEPRKRRKTVVAEPHGSWQGNTTNDPA